MKAIHRARNVYRCLLDLNFPSTTRMNTRSHYVFERMHPIQGDRVKRLVGEDFVYLEPKEVQSPSDMKVILTEDIEGVGLMGDVIYVDKQLVRDKLMPSGTALYPTEENLLANEERLKLVANRPKQGIYAQRTIRQLSGMNLRIPMSPTGPWLLEAKHVRIAFRLAGVEVSESAITMPQEPIVNPTTSMVNVLMNGQITVPVRIFVYYHHNDWSRAPEGDKEAYMKMPPTFPDNLVEPIEIPRVKPKT